ncbi:piwi-like protein Siwi [Pogonomyrmex barbatus]|uniref:Piwi-like protein Siwi n=1 Tax=Pogonomyrmex barbatus TaxID=144034 RepID=A0A6I9VSS5_9HYME|nr:piwi-like protein Siwi [Pogonomyrmex barbatus]XP_011630855.1 piwi-like protein Siwi [Pogonomyrmex barbatus]XP_011630856.1 piwi-like protein Siwi [Pogonomyrmex barbatus]XP_011630857.1 piwi-like protein Siwi [Pogonomyrmex barbatus]XP_025073068.1 piwi-like protein Siwi [Pogonomyrmex barbatus]
MSQRGGRGRGSHGRASQKQTSSMHQEQQLPHAQASSSSGAVRRPGQSAVQSSTGRGVIQRVGEKGDSAAMGQIGRGMERLGIQPTAGASGDASTSATGASSVAVVSSGRGAARGKRILPPDIFVTKPSHVENKKGISGKKLILQTNYFKLLKATDWAIYQYHVDFAPEEDRTIVRKGLLKLHKESIGAYIFDGTVMYTSRRLPDRMVFTSTRQSDEQHITITVRIVGDMIVGDAHYIQFFNIIMRKCYDHLKLKLVGRNYFDPVNKIVLPECKLELWPGYLTSIRQHERDILMCAEITNKVMRLETLVDILRNCYQEDKQRYRENFASTVIGMVVLTDYNNNTYRIEDIDFSTTPSDSFPMKNGTTITYIDYYRKKYGIKISDSRQPMLVTRSKTRGRQAVEMDRVYLVPELCRATGLTDSMRENFRLMSSLAAETRLNPGKRIEKLLMFNNRLRETPAIMQELSEWNLQLDNKLLEISGRELPAEKIYFSDNVSVTAEEGDWTRTMQNKKCIISPVLRNWVLVVTERDKHAVSPFITSLNKVTKGLSFHVENPKIHSIRDDRPSTYNETLEYILSKQIPQLVFCVVSNNRSDRYSAIKKKCCVDRPVPSQVCLLKTIMHKNIMSIATKIAIQMSCKLGGAPWFVDIPLDGLMMVGFDVCHDTTIKTKDFGATVATMNKQMTKYFSAVNAHTNGEELSNELCDNIRKAAQSYYQQNKSLPARIVIYRDGVGEGQVSQVFEREVVQIRKALDGMYGGPNRYKMAFIIVTKRLNTRFFLNKNNPCSGTVVDDVITSPIKYDFFIVSQKVRQGTITPTSYSVIYDTLGLDPDKIQRLTFKLTHMYYNCSTTVRVPAPCHYAHKLAFLVSKFIHREPNTQLQNTLYFL